MTELQRPRRTEEIAAELAALPPGVDEVALRTEYYAAVQAEGDELLAADAAVPPVAAPEPPPPDDEDASPTRRRKRRAARIIGRSDPTDAADPRPSIEIGVDEERVVREAMSALAFDPQVFQRGGHLVHVLLGAESKEQSASGAIAREATAPRISIIPEPWVRTRLAGVARWLRHDSDKDRLVRAAPPDWAVRSTATAGRWDNINLLLGVTETPILRPDGSVLSKPGYDSCTGLLYVPLGQLPSIQENPTRAEALAALEALLEVVVDFPFELPEHRATWVAAVLTPFCRWAFDGPTPLFLFDANVRAAGKSLLARVAAIISYGRMPATMSLPADEDERRKRITALALAGDPLVLLDNIEGVLGGAALNAALTSTTWADRVLGATQTTGNMPLRIVWFATGNNSTLGPDTTRRTVQSRLESDREKPEERTGFAHQDLLGWVRMRRPHLVEAVLTLARAYFVAGCPTMGLPAMGSFEGWTLVRRIVTWAGLPDPLRSQVALADSGDREAAELRGLHAGLSAAMQALGRPVAAKELLDFAGTSSGADFKASLLEHCPGRAGDIPSSARLAGRLRYFKKRVVSGQAIDADPGRAGTVRWLLRNGGVGGDGGVCTAHTRADARTHTRVGNPEAADRTPPSQPTPPDEEPSILEEVPL